MKAGFARYSCQIALPGFGEESQQQLTNAKVLVVGAGGLGCPAAQYLAAAGVGTLGIADFDTVDESNLHRQLLFGPADKGENKALIACRRLQYQNPQIEIIAHEVKITVENVMDIIAGYDIVVDCTDNFETRYLINDAAVISCKPLVYGAIYRYEGQVAVWNVKTPGGFTPNYRDMFSDVNAAQIPDCTTGGVIPTLAGIIGCMQANEVIKYLTQKDDLLAGKLLLFDAQTMQSRVIRIGDFTQIRITQLPQTAAKAIIISAEELKAALQAGTVELIDVREDYERDAFNIGGKHIPLNELETNMQQINPAQVTVFYCASGKRSAQAVEVFKKKFPEAAVFSLEGGLQSF